MKNNLSLKLFKSCIILVKDLIFLLIDMKAILVLQAYCSQV